MQLYHGDCLEIMPTLPDQSIDAIICDLPYGVTSCAWDTVIPFAPLWAQYKRLIKPRGAIVLFGSQPFTSALIMGNVEWFKYEIIWDKVAVTNVSNAKIQPLRSHENIVIFCNGSHIYNPQLRDGVAHRFGKRSATKSLIIGRQGINYQDGVGYPKSILTYMRPNNLTGGGLHPTQKPVALLAYLIRTYTNPGDTVLDNCMGSGSTLVACIQERRNGIGIEQDAGYFAIAQERIANTQPPLPLSDYTMPIAPPAQHELFTETSVLTYG